MMKKILISVLIVFGLSACTSTERTAGGGALLGAATGAIITGNARGALVGGAMGGVAGALIGKARDGRCIYRGRNGRTYRAAC